MLVFLWRRRRDFSFGACCNISSLIVIFDNSRSLCYCHSLLLAFSATGSARNRPPLAGTRRSAQILLRQSKKTSTFVLVFCGGEGVTQTENTISANNKYRIFSYLVFPITRENLKIHRKYS